MTSEQWTLEELLELLRGAQDLHIRQKEDEQYAHKDFLMAQTHLERMASEARRLRNLEREAINNGEKAQNSRNLTERNIKENRRGGLSTDELESQMRRWETIGERSDIDARRFADQAVTRQRHVKAAEDELKVKRKAYADIRRERLTLVKRIQMLNGLISQTTQQR
ncbi:MAG: hypothetical protein O2854_03090 [Chloroflexi bacterium]|nr:hypothetical protein [Chloroflexota bacterium]